MNKKIGHKGFASLLFFLSQEIFLGVGLTRILSISEQNSWISILIAFIIGFIFLNMIMYVMNYKKDLNVFEKIDILFGKFSKIINFILFSLVTLYFMFSLWNLSIYIQNKFLDQTPKFLIMFLFPINVDANEKKEVKFSSCIDGDTARFIMDKKEIKVRFLAIDTPETNHPKKGEEPYGREAKEYTCDKITNAQKIELEFDDGSDEKDKYNRYLAWVYTDGTLLQSELVEKGLAKVAYIYGNYAYTDELKEKEEQAKDEKVGMYSEVDNSYYTTHKEELSKNENKKNEKESDNSKSELEEKIYNKIMASIEKFVNKLLNEIF